MEENVENQGTPENVEGEPKESVAEPQEAAGGEEAAEVKEISQNAMNMAMLCHLLGFFTCFVGPLIIWLLKKDEDPFIDHQGKEALNFQISVTIAMCAGGLLSAVCIGIPILIVVPVLDLIFCIIASVKSSGGQAYRYPLSLRLVK